MLDGKASLKYLKIPYRHSFRWTSWGSRPSHVREEGRSNRDTRLYWGVQNRRTYRI